MFPTHLAVVFYSTAFWGLDANPIKRSTGDILTDKCRYDTRVLCRDCFPDPVLCCTFQDVFVYNKSELPSNAMYQFDRHSIPNGTRFGEDNVVINNLNRNRALDKLEIALCRVYNNCTMWNNKAYLGILREWVMDETRTGGAKICPPGDEEGLARFVTKFNQPELMTLLLMTSNSQSLMVQLGSQHNLAVPSLVFQGGFILVERYEGEPLTNFYQHPFKFRLKITKELITAILKLNAGVDDFRFYLKTISPANIFVHARDGNVLNVTFVALDNVVIVDDLDGRHSRHECICPNYAPECSCTCAHSEKDLFRICQLLLEDDDTYLEGGFLYETEMVPVLERIQKFLAHSLNCEPPNCLNRKFVLRKIHEYISEALYTN